MTTRYTTEETLETLIATFGAAKLVRCLNGRFELRGGNQNDPIEARDWASLFMPEVTIGRR